LVASYAGFACCDALALAIKEEGTGAGGGFREWSTFSTV